MDYLFGQLILFKSTVFVAMNCNGQVADPSTFLELNLSSRHWGVTGVTGIFLVLQAPGGICEAIGHGQFMDEHRVAGSLLGTLRSSILIGWGFGAGR